MRQQFTSTKVIEQQDYLWQKHHSKVVPRIKLNPIPHRSMQIINRIDEELELLSKLSKRRRAPIPIPERIAVRKEPIPNILSYEYSRRPVIKSAFQGGPLLLPSPSVLKPIECIDFKLQVGSPSNRSYLKSPAFYQQYAYRDHKKALKHRYDTEISTEVNSMMIQQPVTIHMQQRRVRRL